LVLFNLLVLYYLYNKHSSYTVTRSEFFNHERTLYGLIDMDIIPELNKIKKNKFVKCISDGTTMFSVIIAFSLVLAILALWSNLFRETKKDYGPNVLDNNPASYVEQKAPKIVK